MRHKPTNKYSGLTIVLSNPSRFDLHKLLTGFAGDFFCQECLGPALNRWQCDIRTSDTLAEGLLPGTQCLLLLGEKALMQWGRRVNSNLNEQRGSPFLVDEVITIASYLPQDVMDIVDHEGRLNPMAEESNDWKDTVKDYTEKKKKGATSRSNWRFFLQKDTQKILRILKNPSLFLSRQQPQIDIYPPEQLVIELLSNCRGKSLYLDLETDCALNITCFGFAIDDGPVYVVPIHRFDYTHAYLNCPKIFHSLALAVSRDNQVVCHNAMFDLFVLAWKCGMPVGKNIYDTMCATHRCFPEAEKSLGHAVGLWTYEPYHKDEGIFMPNNLTQEQALWNYNGKDIWTTRLVRKAIDAYAKRVFGLEASIAQANASIRPYLISSLQGIRYDEQKRAAMVAENDRRMMQYLRIIKVFTGGIEVLPSSNKSCVNYFHDVMCYPPVAKSEKTGKPKLGEEQIQKLRLKFAENPVLNLCLAYRAAQKESGSLGFEPWIKSEEQMMQQPLL